MRSKNVHAAKLILFCFACISVWFLVAQRDVRKIDLAPLSPEDYWAAQISDIGAEAAYVAFASTTEKLRQPEQHLQAHYFGQALYETEGIDSMAICDDRFSWGCFHQFIGEAMRDNGFEIVYRLRKACNKALRNRPNACIHALGHGIMAHLGYSTPDLKKALTLCKAVPIATANHPVNECHRGALMEYSFSLMLGAEKTTRPLTDMGLMYPCDELTGEQQRSCYYVQPQWWRFHFMSESTSESETLLKMGQLCTELSQESRKVCFEGVGTSIAWDFGYKPAKKRALCEKATSNAQDQLSCKTSLAYWIWNIGKSKENPPNPEIICEGLKESSHSECMQYARGNR